MRLEKKKKKQNYWFTQKDWGAELFQEFCELISNFSSTLIVFLRGAGQKKEEEIVDFSTLSCIIIARQHVWNVRSIIPTQHPAPHNEPSILWEYGNVE